MSNSTTPPLGPLTLHIESDAFYAHVRDQILNPETRKDFATKLGILEIAYLNKLRPNEESLKLSAIASIFANRKKKTSKEYNAHVLRAWKRFTKTVGVERISEITSDHMSNYHDTVYHIHDENGYSSAYLKNEFGAVSSIINNAFKKGKDTEELQRVLTLCKMLERPKKKGTDPHPISKKDFHKLYDVADVKFKAILLVMLNACMKSKEISQLDKCEVDMKKGVIVTDRQKTEVVRVCVLWQRTIDAIRQYQKESPHKAKSLFATAKKKPYVDGGKISEMIKGKLREKAKLPDTVKSEDCRDGDKSTTKVVTTSPSRTPIPTRAPATPLQDPEKN